jgi:MerR family redox-sensitive transcriptional activator SoxR
MLMIGEIATRAGLRTSAVRYYERLGLLSAPERRNGRRQYAEGVMDRLAVIRFARETGFTLREIRELLAGRPYSERLRRMAGAKVVQLDEQIERAHAMQAILKMALGCNCLSLEECGRRIRHYTSTRKRQ